MVTPERPSDALLKSVRFFYDNGADLRTIAMRLGIREAEALQYIKEIESPGSMFRATDKEIRAAYKKEIAEKTEREQEEANVRRTYGGRILWTSGMVNKLIGLKNMGYNLKQIADQMSLPPKTVRSKYRYMRITNDPRLKGIADAK